MSLTKARFCSALLALSAWAAPALAADPLVSFVATPSSVQVGQGVDVSVNIANVTDLYGYQFSMTYDASLLQVTGISEGGFLSSGGPTTFDVVDIDNTTGMVSFVFGALLGPIAGVNGSGTLATFHMNTLGVGTSALSFVAADTMFLNSTGTPGSDMINVQLMDSSLQIAAAVPEPSVYAMFALGLAGVALLRRRQGAF